MILRAALRLRRTGAMLIPLGSELVTTKENELPKR